RPGRSARATLADQRVRGQSQFVSLGLREMASSGTQEEVSMTPSGTREYQDTKVEVKIVLSSLWIATLFLFAYVDIFAFWRADVINGALTGEVPGQGLAINQGLLAAATGYIVVPSLMVVVTLLAKARVNRIVNLVVSIFY